jgi:hypothetical protein
MNPADKRLVVMVPDHLIDYIDLEGIIPRGSYGAWPVIVWDSVTSEAVESGDPMEQIKRRKFACILHGKKLRGTFALTRLARRETGKECFSSSRRMSTPTSLEVEDRFDPRTAQEAGSKDTIVPDVMGDLARRKSSDSHCRACRISA